MSSAIPCCMAAWTKAAGNSSMTAPSPPIFTPKPLPARPISQASMATRKVCCLVGMSTPLCMVAPTSASPTRPSPPLYLLTHASGGQTLPHSVLQAAWDEIGVKFTFKIVANAAERLAVFEQCQTHINQTGGLMASPDAMEGALLSTSTGNITARVCHGH